MTDKEREDYEKRIVGLEARVEELKGAVIWSEKRQTQLLNYAEKFRGCHWPKVCGDGEHKKCPYCRLYDDPGEPDWGRLINSDPHHALAERDRRQAQEIFDRYWKSIETGEHEDFCVWLRAKVAEQGNQLSADSPKATDNTGERRE